MDENKTAANTDEAAAAAAQATAEPAAAEPAAAGAAGSEAAAKETTPKDAPAKADAAAPEAAAKADTAKADPVTEKEPAKPAAEKKEPAKEPDKDKPKPDPQVEQLTDKLGKAEKQLRQSMAKAAALMVGVRSDRVKAAVTLAEITGLDPLADDADQQFETALQAVVDNMPELTAAPAGTGSPGAFQRKKEPAKTAFEKGLEA